MDCWNGEFSREALKLSSLEKIKTPAKTAKIDMDDKLFSSASKMAGAENYNDWTYSLFEGSVKGSVLEVGCGVGSFTKRIIDSGSFKSLLSIDISEDSIQYCRSRFKHDAMEFKCMDVTCVEGKFDTIICMNVLEHIKEDLSALRHMLGLLNPSGTLFLLVPAHQFLFSQYDIENGHYRRYSKSHLQRLVTEAAGGSGVRVTQFYFNIVGALGYFFVYKILKKAPRSAIQSELSFFDNWVVPVMRRLECRRMPLGISLVSIITKE